MSIPAPRLSQPIFYGYPLPSSDFVCEGVPPDPEKAKLLDRVRGEMRRRNIQELLGHSDVSTTIIYTHVLNRGGRGVRSPLDLAP